MKVIYNLGSNNGDDIEYYLLKADRVVAVEANPRLIDEISVRFRQAIDEQRLFIESVVVTVDDSEADVDFFISKKNHVLSQLPKPAESEELLFDKVCLPSRNLLKILGEYGSPHYIKIDLEGYDDKILRCLFSAGIFPDYLSAESHDVDVFATLVAIGGYKRFKLINCIDMQVKYGQHQISTEDGILDFPFRFHSSGPFGNDIIGEWQCPNTFFRNLSSVGLGWIDIHASRVD